MDNLTGREIIIVEGYLVLEFDEHPLVTKKSLEQVLKELYRSPGLVEKLKIEEHIEALVTSCYLELQRSADHQVDQIIQMIGSKTVAKLISILDKTLTSDMKEKLAEIDDDEAVPFCGDSNIFGYRMLKKCHGHIKQKCLMFLCQMVAQPTFDCMSFASLPMAWFQEIISSEKLVISSEYARYGLLKRILDLRDDCDASSSIKVELENGGSFLGNLSDAISGVIGRKGKRKTDFSERELEGGGDDAENDTSRSMKRSKSNNSISSPKLRKSHSQGGFLTPATLVPSASLSADAARVFEKAAICTYMTFPQLDTIKKDGLISPNIILQSFWMQQELTHRCTSSSTEVISVNHGGHGPFPPFRFGARFRNVRRNLVGSMKQGMHSDPVICAGVQYRAMLQLSDDGESKTKMLPSLSLKALLQRTKNGNSPVASFKISYDIYKFDSTMMDGHEWMKYGDSVTRCNENGDGYARIFHIPKNLSAREIEETESISSDGIGKEQVDESQEDDLWLIVNINFV